MKYFVDTNVFIRLLVDKNHVQYHDCLELFALAKFNHLDLFTTSLGFSEIEWVCRSNYSLPKESIAEIIESILNSSGIKITNNFDDNLSLKLFQKHKVKFVDCQIASIPEIYEKKWTVVSFDKDFDKLGVIRKTPKQVVVKYKK